MVRDAVYRLLFVLAGFAFLGGIYWVFWELGMLDNHVVVPVCILVSWITVMERSFKTIFRRR